MLVRPRVEGLAEGGARTGSRAAPPVALAAADLLRQCAAFVRCVNDRVYAAESGTLKGGTIGKHVRHVLDHFRAALDASEGGAIDYDSRARNVPMESDRALALASIDETLGRLAPLDSAALSRAVRVRAMLCGDGTCAELGSTLGRELAFAAHHAVHHHAMLKAIAAEFGVDAGPDFGKAPATIHHERRPG